MSSSTPLCQLVKEPDMSVIRLSGEVNILQASLLKDLFLQAVARNKPIRVNMADLEELDVTAIQLLCAAKKMASKINLSFDIGAASEITYVLMTYAGLSYLLPAHTSGSV